MNTLNAQDQLNGNGGTDTLNAIIDSSVTPLSLQNIEIINLTNANTGDRTVGLVNAGQALEVTNSGSSGNLAITGLAATATMLNVFDVSGDDTTFTYISSAGTQTVDLAVDNVTTDLANAAEITLAGIENINITSGDGTSQANAFTLNANGANTIAIDGDADLTLTLGGVTRSVSSINASTATGDVNVTLIDQTGVSSSVAISVTGGLGDDTFDVSAETTSNVSATGGAGSDTFVFGANLATTDTVAGGEGTGDTLSATSARLDSTNTYTNISGIEAVTVSDNLGGNLVLSQIQAGIETVNLGGTAAGRTITFDAGIDGDVNVNDVLSAATTTIAVAGSGTADTVTLSNNNAAGEDAFNGASITATGVEALDIVTSAPGSLVWTQTLGTISVTGSTGATASETVNFSGANNLTVGVITADIINASGLTATSGTTFNQTAAAAGAATITGSSGNDVLRGATAAASSVSGGAGNDSIYGGSANDKLNGEAGNDSITAGAGNDSISGGDGNDRVVFATAGDLTLADSVDGGTGTNALVGVSADLVTLGSAARTTFDNIQTVEVSDAIGGNINVANIDSTVVTVNATYTGGPINTVANTITGNAGTLTVGLGGSAAGATHVLGAALTVADTGTGTTDSVTIQNKAVNSDGTPAGINVFAGLNVTSTGYENVTINTGTVAGDQNTIGTLTITPDSTSANVSLTVTGVNALDITTSLTTSSTGLLTVDASGMTAQAAGTTTFDLNSTSQGSGGTASITGSAGDDAITVGNFASTILGGIGTDTLTGGSANDSIDGEAGNDNISGLGGNDILKGGEGTDTVYGGDGNDVIDGGAAADSLYGGTGNDSITSGAGNDVMYGGLGNDTLTATSGNDTVGGDAGTDSLVAGSGNDVFVYNTLTDSQSGNSATFLGDTIDGFDFAADKFSLSGAVGSVGTLTIGTADLATLNTTLSGNANLTSLLTAARSTVLLTIQGGTAAGTYMVIASASGAYSSTDDAIVQLVNAANTGSYGTSNFTTGGVGSVFTMDAVGTVNVTTGVTTGPASTTASFASAGYSTLQAGATSFGLTAASGSQAINFNITTGALSGADGANANDLLYSGVTSVTGSDNNDTFTIAAANITTTVDGANGTDTLIVTGAGSTLDLSGTRLVDLQNLNVSATTGANTITTDVDTLSITTSAYADNITFGNATGDAVTVDATALVNDVAISLEAGDSTDTVTVNNLVGDIDANLSNGTVLASALVVNLANNTSDNDITVVTGNSATTIAGGVAGDTVTVNAAAFNTKALTVSGAAGYTINGLNTTSGAFANTLNFSGSVASTVNLITAATQTDAVINNTGAGALSVLIAGSGGGGTNDLTLGGTGTVTASGAGLGTADGVTAVAINDDATGTFNINFTTAATSATATSLNSGAAGASLATVNVDATTLAAALTLTGDNAVGVTNLIAASGGIAGSALTGVATISGTSAQAHSITTGSAADFVTITSASSQTGVQTINTGAGNDTITLATTGGANVVTGGTGADTITGGAGADDIYADNAGTKAVDTVAITVGAASTGTATLTILGTAVTVNVGADATATGAALVTAVNGSSALAGLVTASTPVAGSVELTFLVDGALTSANAVSFSATDGSNTGSWTATTAGTNGAWSIDNVVGGAGADLIAGGGQADTLTGDAGIDNFFFLKGQSTVSANGTASITDYRATAGNNAGAADIITIGDQVAVAGTSSTVLDLSSSASLGLALNSAANTNVVNNGLSVFLWGGNAYAYVETSGAGTTYAGTDFVVALVGNGGGWTTATAIAGLGIDGV